MVVAVAKSSLGSHQCAPAKGHHVDASLQRSVLRYLLLVELREGVVVDRDMIITGHQVDMALVS